MSLFFGEGKDRFMLLPPNPTISLNDFGDDRRSNDGGVIDFSLSSEALEKAGRSYELETGANGRCRR